MNSATQLARVMGRSMNRLIPVATRPPQPPAKPLHPRYSAGTPCAEAGSRDRRFSLHHYTRRVKSAVTIYQLTDRLHSGHTALVPGDEIAMTLSAWLAQLDAASSLVDDLAHAVKIGDWPTTYAIGQKLSVDVSVAAQPI